MTDHLLPPSASEQERAIASACAARCEAMQIPLRALWDPATCPADLLPWLAWALSVDVWDPAWPEATRRAVIAASMDVHRIKGTVASVRRAVGALGSPLAVAEWWQYGGEPYTAKLAVLWNEVNDDGSGLSVGTLEAAQAIAEATAPVRVHWGQVESGALYRESVAIAAALSRPCGVLRQAARTPNQVDTASRGVGLAAALGRPCAIRCASLYQPDLVVQGQRGLGLAAAATGAYVSAWVFCSPVVEPIGDGLGTGIAWFVAGAKDDMLAELTSDVLDDIAATAETVTLQVRGDSDGSALAGLFSALLARRPNLPIAVYIWFSVSYSPSGGWPEEQVKGWADDHPEWVAWTSGNMRYADLSLPAARADLVARAAAMAATLDAMLSVSGNPVGIFYDLTFRLQTWASGEELLRQAAGCDLLLAEYRAAMPDRRHVINGLWSNIQNMPAQRYAVRHATGAMIEYFGMRPSTNTGTWADDIQPYLDAIAADPISHWQVNGRWPWDATHWPFTQAQWGLYLYAAYLLASGPRTCFHYLRTFQILPGDPQALYVVPEQRYTLGAPLGQPTTSGPLRVRRFAAGLAALCQHDQSASGTLALLSTYYDRVGTAYTGTVTLVPGQALVLFTQNPA